MLRKKLSKGRSVSDKITELFNRQVNGDDHSSDEATEEPRVEQEFDEYDLPDARSSDIRKRNVKLLSEQSVRYRGKISSRKELEIESDQEDTEEDDEEEESTDEAIKAFTTKLSNSKPRSSVVVDEFANEGDDSQIENGNDDVSSNDSEEDNADYDKYEDDEDDDDDEDNRTDVDVNSEVEDMGTDIVAESNRQSEVQKGKCVQNQLCIWERLLEVRIHTQKLLNKANKLPAPNVLKAHVTENDDLARISRQSVEGVRTLLSSLLELKRNVCRQHTEYSKAMKNTLKRPLPLYEPEKHGVPPIKRVAEHLDAQFQEQKTYRNAVLLKWDDRTKLLTPGAGAKKKSLAEDYDIIRKIDSALQQRNALIEKSQILKDDMSNMEPVGAEENGICTENMSKRNKDIYDDSDFYHQQLRELIEYKTNSSTNASELTQQYVELQKLRQKMKKKVDTRASKGRKLRYTVHNKLVNFMAPDDKSAWTDESKDELYRSLFAA